MAEPIRVMHVVLSMDMGGLERIVDDLVRRADRSVLEPSVCCVERPGHFAKDLLADGFRVVSLDKGPGLRLRGFTRSVRAMRELRPDVVHTHQVGALFYAGPAARRAKVPVVVHTEHGRHFGESRRLRIIGRFAAGYADRIFTVSDDIAEDAFKWKVYSPDSTRTVLNGIDVERFSRPMDVSGLKKELGLDHGCFVVGTVARLSPVKDQQSLIRAFEMLRRRKPEAHLVFVGDGPSRPELEGQVKSAGLDGSVHFAGAREDVVPYLRLFNAFVLSSLSEGMPLVILEAMAAGIPVVSTAVGGIPKIITEGKTGVLVPSGDPERLARALSELADNPARRADLARAGSELVRDKYSLERMAGNYLEEYRGLLESKGRLPGKRQGGSS